MDRTTEILIMKLQNYKNNIYSKFKCGKQILNSQRENSDPLIFKKEVKEDRFVNHCSISSKKERNSRDKKALYICLYLNIILIGSVVVLTCELVRYLRHHQQPSCQQSSDDDTRVYAACSDDNVKSIKATVIGHLCSLSVKGNPWHVLLHLILSEKLRNISTPTLQHDRLYFHGDVNIKGLEDNKLSWNDPYLPMVHSGNTGTEDSVYITKPGIYYVYNQITIKTMENDKNLDLSHSLCVSVVDKHQNCRLLTSTAFKRIKGTMSFQTSFLDGMFYLRKGDVIKVRVSDNSAVYKFGNGNYLGFYFITTQNNEIQYQ